MESQYDAEIRAIELQEHELDTRKRELLQLRAEALCPFNVEDILVNWKGQKARLTEIRSTGYFYEHSKSYKLFGHFIRKDGKEGKLLRELWDFEEKL